MANGSSARVVSIPASGGEAGLNRYLARDQEIPDPRAGRRIHAGQALARASATPTPPRSWSTRHLRLVAKIAMGYRGYGLPVSELISEGNIGLMQGVKKFEPERGFRLATYADVVDPRLDPGIHPAHRGAW